MEERLRPRHIPGASALSGQHVPEVLTFSVVTSAVVLEQHEACMLPHIHCADVYCHAAGAGVMGGVLCNAAVSRGDSVPHSK